MGRKNKVPSVQIERRKVKAQARLSRIKELTDQFITDDWLVMVQRSALLKDNINGNVYMQMKLCNQGQATLQSVRLKVLFYNDAGDALDNGKELEVEYIDLNCQAGKDFGSKKLFVVSPSVDSYTIQEIKVVCGDGTVRTYLKKQIVKLPRTKTLKGTLPEQYNDFLEANRLYCLPEAVNNDVYRCACGGLIQGEGQCKVCGRTYKNALEAVSEKRIEAEYRLQKQIAEDEKHTIKLFRVFLIAAVFATGFLCAIINIYMAILFSGEEWKKKRALIAKWWYLPSIIFVLYTAVVSHNSILAMPLSLSIVILLLYSFVSYKIKSYVQNNGAVEKGDNEFNFAYEKTLSYVTDKASLLSNGDGKSGNTISIISSLVLAINMAVIAAVPVIEWGNGKDYIYGLFMIAWAACVVLKKNGVIQTAFLVGHIILYSAIYFISPLFIIVDLFIIAMTIDWIELPEVVEKARQFLLKAWFAPGIIYVVAVLAAFRKYWRYGEAVYPTIPFYIFFGFWIACTNKMEQTISDESAIGGSQ